MVTKELAEASTEISVILDNLSSDILNKIPKDIREYFKINASDTYNFEYDKTKTLNEQQLKPKTKGIIAFLYRDYVCSDNEKQEYNAEYTRFIEKMEQEKIEFNPTELFATTKNEEYSELTVSIVQQKDKWYTKIVNWIKCKFRK